MVISLLSSCVTPKQTNYLQDITKNYGSDEVAPIDYRIIQGDQLMLTVYTLDESMKTLFASYVKTSYSTPAAARNASGTGGVGGTGTSASGANSALPENVLNVDSDGTVRIPYIGHIHVQGLTVLEAKKILNDKFRDFSPNVTVDLALRNRQFYLLGEMGTGAVQMTSLRMNIFQALAVSGANIALYGDRKKVKIVRQTPEGTEIKIFDIRSQDIVDSEYYYIQPNDVIYVEQRQSKFFGSITSFASVFGFVASMLGIVTLIVKLAK